MTTIIIRATDAATALDEVKRRLGPDALIVSTRQHNGQVEIKATTAATLVSERPSVTEYRSTSSPQRFQAHLEQAQSRDGKPALCWPLDITGRVILIGPPGSGCSLLAARLAAMTLRDADSPKPVLIAPRKDLLSATSKLAGWARLMDVLVHRPVWTSDIPASLPLPDKDRLEILDLSDVGWPDTSVLKNWAALPETQIWLVLPTGLHEQLHQRLCTGMSEIIRMIVLTRADLCPPTPDDQALNQRFGVPVGLVASGTGLLDTLAQPAWPDFAHETEGCSNPDPALPQEGTDPSVDQTCSNRPVFIRSATHSKELSDASACLS